MNKLKKILKAVGLKEEPRPKHLKGKKLACKPKLIKITLFKRTDGIILYIHKKDIGLFLTFKEGIQLRNGITELLPPGFED